ncbi:MAG: ribosomal-processing cysteine protease Prp [Lachnospiraceae bacterium]|nr:ribosomal-processing cysteine protease Prp [Lachnospiraceae bacterium]
MTTIKYTDQDITVSGHAGYSHAGSDIVCAGISSLAQTLIMAIEQETKDKIEYRICLGDVSIHFCSKPDSTGSVSLIFWGDI